MCDQCAVRVRKEWGLPSMAAIPQPVPRIWRPAFSLATAAVFGAVAVAFGLVGFPPTAPPVSTPTAASVAPAPVVAAPVVPPARRVFARAPAQGVSERSVVAHAGEPRAAPAAPRPVPRFGSRSRAGIVLVRARMVVDVEPRVMQELVPVVAIAQVRVAPMERVALFVLGPPAAVELQVP